jgi:hypothetical protein
MRFWAHQQKDNTMPSYSDKTLPAIHRVKCAKFSPQKLNGKKLRYFRHERPEDYDMDIAALQPDGSFILTVFLVQPDPPAPEGKTAQIHIREVSLDQATVDKIEAAPSCAFLHGCDFVIFQDSPKSRELCAA